MDLAFHPVDIILIIYLLVAVGHGIRRGLSEEVFAFVRTVVALAIAWTYYQPFGEFLALNTRLSDEASARILAFALLFIAATVAFILVGVLLRLWLEFKTRPATEHLGGAAFGFVRGAVVISAVVVAVSLSGTTYIKEQVVSNSRIGSTLDDYLTPAYLRLARENPGLRLPYPSTPLVVEEIIEEEAP